jgi:hypothetical protein
MKRCPNGTRRDKKTGECISIENKFVKSPIQSATKNMKRCPNGTRRNKKTGECEKIEN